MESAAGPPRRVEIQAILAPGSSADALAAAPEHLPGSNGRCPPVGSAAVQDDLAGGAGTSSLRRKSRGRMGGSAGGGGTAVPSLFALLRLLSGGLLRLRLPRMRCWRDNKVS